MTTDAVVTEIGDEQGRRLDSYETVFGVRSIRFDPDGSHLAKLQELTDGQLADVVIDATGSPRSMSTCFDYAAFTGRVVYVGITTDCAIDDLGDRMGLAWTRAPTRHDPGDRCRYGAR